MTTSAFWSIAGRAGGAARGETLWAGDAAEAALAPGDAPALAEGLALVAFGAVVAVFLHIGRLRASRQGRSANRVSIKVALRLPVSVEKTSGFSDWAEC